MCFMFFVVLFANSFFLFIFEAHVYESSGAIHNFTFFFGMFCFIPVPFSHICSPLYRSDTPHFSHLFFCSLRLFFSYEISLNTSECRQTIATIENKNKVEENERIFPVNSLIKLWVFVFSARIPFYTYSSHIHPHIKSQAKSSCSIIIKYQEHPKRIQSTESLSLPFDILVVLCVF